MYIDYFLQIPDWYIFRTKIENCAIIHIYNHIYHVTLQDCSIRLIQCLQNIWNRLNIIHLFRNTTFGNTAHQFKITRIL